MKGPVDTTTRLCLNLVLSLPIMSQLLTLIFLCKLHFVLTNMYVFLHLKLRSSFSFSHFFVLSLLSRNATIDRSSSLLWIVVVLLVRCLHCHSRFWRFHFNRDVHYEGEMVGVKVRLLLWGFCFLLTYDFRLGFMVVE